MTTNSTPRPSRSSRLPIPAASLATRDDSFPIATSSQSFDTSIPATKPCAFILPPRVPALRCELGLAQPFGLIKEIRPGNPCSSAGLEALGVSRLTRPVLQNERYRFPDIQGVARRSPPGWSRRSLTFARQAYT